MFYRRIGFWSTLLLLFFLSANARSEQGSSLMKVNEYLRSGSSYGLGIQSLGLFDPSRMTFSHSYTLSYLSAGDQGVMRGLFMETIGYRLSRPISLTFNVGYLHQPYSSYGPSSPFGGGAFIGGAALDWRPTENMFLHFEVANYPSSSGIYGFYPYWYSFPGNVPAPPPANNIKTNSELNSSGK